MQGSCPGTHTSMVSSPLRRLLAWSRRLSGSSSSRGLVHQASPPPLLSSTPATCSMISGVISASPASRPFLAFSQCQSSSTTQLLPHTKTSRHNAVCLQKPFPLQHTVDLPLETFQSLGCHQHCRSRAMSSIKLLLNSAGAWINS